VRARMPALQPVSHPGLETGATLFSIPCPFPDLDVQPLDLLVERRSGTRNCSAASVWFQLQRSSFSMMMRRSMTSRISKSEELGLCSRSAS